VKGVAVLVVLWPLICAQGCGDSEPGLSDGERAEVAVVALYCLYGAQSKAQFHGCATHVSPERVLELATRKWPTNAASFALGIRKTCGYDSGPMCPESRALVNRTIR